MRQKNPVFRATRPYLSEPADPRLFFRKYRFVGVFIIEISILKKTEPTLPKDRCPKHNIIIFWPDQKRMAL